MPKYSPSLVVSLWVMALALSGVTVALRTYRASLQAEFEDTATIRVSALQRSLDEKLLILQSMHSLYAIFDGMPQPQFRTFVQPFEDRLEGVQALQWVVPVRAADRATFENTLQAAGIAGFQITERNAAGNMVRAGERDLYFPVYPLLPLDEGEASIGFDLASTPVRKAALEQAISSGELSASGRIELLQDNSPGEYGFIVVDPLFAPGVAGSVGSLQGLVLGVFRLSSIVEAVHAQFAPEAIRLEIFDTSATPAAALLLSQPEAADPIRRSNVVQRFFMPRAVSKTIGIGGRVWEVRAFAMPGYLNGRQPLAAWLLFGSGVLLSLVLAIYLKMRSRHEARLQLAEKQRESLENQLFRSQRLEAIGQLVGGVAHDFKNLLNSILGNSELLSLELTEAKAPLRNYVRHIERAAGLGNGLIQKLLSFSRNEPTVPTPQALAPLVKNTLAMLRPLIPVRISFQTAIEPDLPPVLIDATSFDQILVNLCINARDAISGEGRITIALQQQEIASDICLSCGAVTLGHHVVLTLTDSGSGISEEALLHIFDPFFTTKAADKGTGLGLAIVHNIVHGCGGHILLHSVAGEGTTFRILFPVEHNAARQVLRKVG